MQRELGQWEEIQSDEILTKVMDGDYKIYTEQVVTPKRNHTTLTKPIETNDATLSMMKLCPAG